MGRGYKEANWQQSRVKAKLRCEVFHIPLSYYVQSQQLTATDQGKEINTDLYYYFNLNKQKATLTNQNWDTML